MKGLPEVLTFWPRPWAVAPATCGRSALTRGHARPEGISTDGPLGSADDPLLRTVAQQEFAPPLLPPQGHDWGREHAGIAYRYQQSRSIGDIIRGMELIWEVLEPEEMRNRVEYI